MAMKLSRLHHSFWYSHPVVTDLQMHSSETVAMVSHDVVYEEFARDGV